MRRSVVASLIAMGLTLGVSVLRATPLLDVYNTGVVDQVLGNLLADGASDPHYLLTASADPSYPAVFKAVVIQSQVWPLGLGNPWVADGLNSKWIGPRTDAINGDPPGTYRYRTTFDLTGFVPSTAVINGNWATDNNGVDIILNNNSLGHTTGFADFGALNHPFTISSGFVPNINTLDFEVYNGQNSPGDNTPNPTGLRVELSGSADPSGIPEPATLGLIGLGLLGVGLLRRRLAVR